MQKFWRMPVYVSVIAFHLIFTSLYSLDIGNSLMLFSKKLENLTTKLEISEGIPKIPETPKKPVSPKKPVTPKIPTTPKKPETPKKPATPKTPTIPKKQETQKVPETPKTAQDNIGHLALQYTNDFRHKNGLSPLKWNQKIADLCTEHSKNMADGKVPFGHDGFQARVKRFPGRYTSAAENVYMISSSNAVARDAVDGWIGSPGHRKNLLSNSTDCGIGAYKGQRGWYVTQMFARF